MSIRMIDTNIWREDWYLSLPGEEQLFVRYIYDNCDHAGIYKPNVIGFSKLTGFKININEFLDHANIEKERIYVLPNKRWFIRDFIKFQCFNKKKEFKINLNVIMQRSAHAILKLNEVPESKINGFIGLIGEGVRQGVSQPLKNKDKDIVVDFKSLKSKAVKAINTSNFSFNTIASKYPNKDGSKAAERHFNKSVKTDKDWQDINKALNNYLQCKHVKDGFIKSCSTWFNNWRDWIDQKPEESVVKF